MEAALDLRTRCLSSPVSFEAEVRADYITSIECFELACTFDGAGEMTFSVTEPEEISGIRGTVRGTEGTVQFDETALAFPLLAEGRISPLSAPWVLMKAIRSGCILAAGTEGILKALRFELALLQLVLQGVCRADEDLLHPRKLRFASFCRIHEQVIV